MEENNKVEIIESKEEVADSPVAKKEKKSTEWERMKRSIFSHKRYIFTLFPVILVSIFLGSMCSSFQKNGHTLAFVFCLSGVIILLGLSIFLVTITKKILKENSISMNVYISIVFAYMFFSGLVLMVAYKILSMIDSKNILNITGLTSVIILIVYILLVIASIYIDFSKIKNIFKHKKK